MCFPEKLAGASLSLSEQPVGHSRQAIPRGFGDSPVGGTAGSSEAEH